MNQRISRRQLLLTLAAAGGGAGLLWLNRLFGAPVSAAPNADYRVYLAYVGRGSNPVPPTGATVVDHTNVGLFSTIPDSYVAAAANLNLMLRRASVGGNISAGLDAIFTANNKYNRSHWIFYDRGNPGWQAKITDLETTVASQAGAYQVFSQKFCYIDNVFNYTTEFTNYRDSMNNLQATYPGKAFVWWTMPIMTTGDAYRDGYNNLVRNYAKSNGKILFDIADIESHDPSGNPISNGGYEAMSSPYSSDGGHLSNSGADRVAKGWWVLMAQVAGWKP